MKEPENITRETKEDKPREGTLINPSIEDVIVIGERAYNMANYYYSLVPKRKKASSLFNESSDLSAGLAALYGLASELYLKSIWYRTSSCDKYITGHDLSELMGKLSKHATEIVYYYANRHSMNAEEFDTLLEEICSPFVSHRYNFELFEYYVDLESVFTVLQIFKESADDINCRCDTGKGYYPPK